MARCMGGFHYCLPFSGAILKWLGSFATLTRIQIGRRPGASLHYTLLPWMAILQWFVCFAALVQRTIKRRGTAALYATPEVSTAQRALATTIMGAVGQVHWLEDESQMDAVTALSGSGPAYVFRLLECLEEAGVDLGLPAPLARALALETVGGAAALAQGSPLPPSVLRVQVTSPGGTTERALQVLDEGNLDALFQRALRAARDRSRTLAEEFGAP